MGTAGDDETPLRVEGLDKRWPGQPSPVLAGLDLTVEAGEALAISGANGAGKTTLLRIITGILDPDAGAVAVCGRTLQNGRAAFQRALGFLSAGNAGLYARLTPRQHLALWADLAFLGPAQRRAAIERTLAQWDLAQLADRRTDRLSMGQRQRVRLAMTFLHEPRLVLLDEPLTSLDAAGAGILEAAAQVHRARGGALVWCSPGGAHAAGEFDRHLALVAGRLEAADQLEAA